MVFKLNFKSIIKWEQYTGRSYWSIDQTNEDDLMTLLFCIVVTNNENMGDLEDFKQILSNKKIGREIVNKYSKISKHIELFTSKRKKEQTDQTPPENTELPFIMDDISKLIISGGLDVNYVMYNMEWTEFEMFFNAFNEREKMELENNRLWTFFNVSPHVSDKKFTSPQKLIEFPWENKQPKKQTLTNDQIINILQNIEIKKN